MILMRKMMTPTPMHFFLPPPADKRVFPLWRGQWLGRVKLPHMAIIHYCYFSMFATLAISRFIFSKFIYFVFVDIFRHWLCPI